MQDKSGGRGNMKAVIDLRMRLKFKIEFKVWRVLLLQHNRRQLPVKRVTGN